MGYRRRRFTWIIAYGISFAFALARLIPKSKEAGLGRIIHGSELRHKRYQTHQAHFYHKHPRMGNATRMGRETKHTGLDIQDVDESFAET